MDHLHMRGFGQGHPAKRSFQALRIAVNDDEIGPFPGLERTDFLLGEPGISRAASVGLERLPEREPLARDPPAGRLPVSSPLPLRHLGLCSHCPRAGKFR